MSDFWLYFTSGLYHVLDIGGYDHVLFTIALIVPYMFRDWRNILLLITLFTIGHTMTLILSVYDIISIRADLVEFLIPLTILFTAFYNIIKSGKSAKKENITAKAYITLFFGIVHGLGFSNYFKIMLDDNNNEKLLPLLEFALGVEAAHFIVVLAVLILSFLIQNVFRFSKRDWVLVASAFVIGVAVPMLAENKFW